MKIIMCLFTESQREEQKTEVCVKLIVIKYFAVIHANRLLRIVMNTNTHGA